MALVKHTRARMLFGGSCCWATVMMIGSLLPGCGGPPERWPDGGRIQGSVTFDGAPLSSGRVVVSCATLGATDASGIDSAGRYAFARKLPVGDYVVWLDGGDLPPPGEAPTPWPYAGRIPREYQSESNTPLRLTVAKGVNEFPIAIDSSRSRGAASGDRK